MTKDSVSGGLRRRDLLRTAGIVGAGGSSAALLGRPGVASAATSASTSASATGSTLAKAAGQVPAPTPAVPDAPLLADPIYNGSTDPTIVYNSDFRDAPTSAGRRKYRFRSMSYSRSGEIRYGTPSGMSSRSSQSSRSSAAPPASGSRTGSGASPRRVTCNRQ
jgi:hypothetical protein